MVTVHMLLRKPYLARHSMERLFDRICQAMPADIRTRKFVSTFAGRGILRRLAIMVEAMFRQGDVTHVTGENHFVTLLLRRRRTILTIHDVLPPFRANGVRGWLMRLFWYRLPMARAAVITVVSEATLRRLVELGLAGKHDIRVVPNCTFAEFTPISRTFTAEYPRILLVGTAWNKNVERVAEALSGIRCHVRVIGKLTASHRDAFQRNGVSMSSANTLSDKEVLDEYTNCDVVVFASIEEGFGLPILEAQAIGRPVVTSNLSSMPEVAGAAAELVDPHSVSSIRRGVMRVLEDQPHRDRLVQLGFLNVQRFSPESIARMYADIYRELAGERPTHRSCASARARAHEERPHLDLKVMPTRDSWAPNESSCDNRAERC